MPTEKSLSKIDFSAYDYSKVYPKQESFFPTDAKSGYVWIHFHRRAKKLEVMNLFDGSWNMREKLISEDFKSIFEVMCRSAICPLPFNVDLYGGGNCFGCCYCFSIRTEQSLLSAFFDNWRPGMRRHVNMKFLDDQVNAILGGVSKQYAYFVERRIPLRCGNRSENFWHDERTARVSLELLKKVKEFNYPFIIGTKSKLLLEEPWFKALGDIADHLMVEVTITTPDERIAKLVEPMAPTVAERWNLIKTLNASGIYAVPRLEPMLVTVHEDFGATIQAYADKMLECGAKHVLGDALYPDRSKGTAELFGALGYDFDYEQEVVNSDIISTHSIINKACSIFQKNGIDFSTIALGSIPFTKSTDCCGSSVKFGDVATKPNIWRAMFELIHRRPKLGLTEFLKEYPAPSYAWMEQLHDLWTSNAPMGHQGLSAQCMPGLVIDGIDENEFPIYSYSDKEAFDSYYHMIEKYNLWEMLRT